MVIRKISILIFISFFVIQILNAHAVYAKDTVKVELDPIACGGVSCPTNFDEIYSFRGESCAATFDEFKTSPVRRHFWIEDPEVRAQSQSNERARQFISWVLNKNAIDDHPALKTIWNTTRNLSYFFVILVAAILGIGFIVGQRTSFQLKIRVWPSIGKVAGALLFITFSAAIVLLIIQLSELLMKLFIETLGGRDLFNIYFAGSSSSETNYINSPGCRDLNFTVQEAARTELLMMKLTNITYYVMGGMIILRKIILWFLLFVSPFLAILFSFSFIRNIGWIWIGVFFQWIFYGPLFALFLGALNKIWKEGIPFIFDFQRADSLQGYIYPTAINILYGGPAQNGIIAPRLSPKNNGNYIDTFVEYVITLIMLWAVIVLPWWLLRIFRDYCCDGIKAMKNILLSMYDQMRNNPSSSPPPSVLPHVGTTIKMPQDVKVPLNVKLETIEQIKRTKTEEIVKTLNLSATRLTDIARLETNKQTQETVRRNIDYLANPTKAQTPVERQKYMNIRTELFNRAIKEDTVARRILTSTTTSTLERAQTKQTIFKEAPQLTPMTSVVSYKVKMPVEKISSVTSSFTNSLSSLQPIINNIAQKTQTSPVQVQTILSSYKQNVQQSPGQVIKNIAKQTGIEKEQITNVMKQVSEVIKTNKEVAATVAQKEQIQVSDVEKIIQTQIPLVAEPETHIEQSIAVPSTVSIEDYEEVKKMWVNQYEKGEVPVTENMTSRGEWIDQDIIFITNTLNKILSSDEQIKNQGLDEVGYILPIFMINNLKGEELLVYLKAKLEAAKHVQSQMEREQEITEKLKSQTEEILVDAPQKKEEATKTMTMEESLPLPTDEKKEPTAQ